VAEVGAGLADSGAVMGRHLDAADTSRHLRRTAQYSGLAGGIAWVAAAFLDAGSEADLLHWLGGVLLTVALFGLGLLLVKSDVLPLRIFVALALPTLVWGVVALLRDSTVNTTLVDVAFGGTVALVSAVQLVRRTQPRRSTL
jgi:hypothetical protein